MVEQTGKEINLLLQAESLLESGQLDGAKEVLAQALGIAPTSGQTHRLIGKLYSAMQDEESARVHYEEARRLDRLQATARARPTDEPSSRTTGRDSDDGRAGDMPWHDDDWIWEERDGRPTLFVLFAGLGIDDDPPTFIFYNFLKNVQAVDKLFVRDLGRRWYLDGLGELSANAEETTRLLREKCAGYERTVFIGSSAGGMAAILFGELIGADKIVSFAPQTVLTDAKEREIGDQRWPRLMQQIRDRHETSKFLDLKHLNPLATAIDIHFASGCDIDRGHAERLTGDKLRRIPHEEATGHLIALHLRDTGKLSEIIAAEIPKMPQ